MYYLILLLLLFLFIAPQYENFYSNLTNSDQDEGNWKSTRHTRNMSYDLCGEEYFPPKYLVR